MKPFLAIALAAAIAAATPAHAVPTLQLMISDGVTTSTLIDTTHTGVITFNGSIGNFSVNVATGIDEKKLGVTSYPAIDLSSVHVSSNVGGILTIWLTEIGVSSTTNSRDLLALIGGTTNGSSILYNAYEDVTNAAFGLGSGAMISKNFTNGAFSSQMWATGGHAYVPNALFSMTEKLVITATGASATSYDAELRMVPEPGAIAVLGVGLLGLGMIRSVKRKTI